MLPGIESLCRCHKLLKQPINACVQVASILLPLCFVYDVFWVFLQPLLTHGDSVMVKVRCSHAPGLQWFVQVAATGVMMTVQSFVLLCQSTTTA